MLVKFFVVGCYKLIVLRECGRCWWFIFGCSGGIYGLEMFCWRKVNFEEIC